MHDTGTLLVFHELQLQVGDLLPKHPRLFQISSSKKIFFILLFCIERHKKTYLKDCSSAKFNENFDEIKYWHYLFLQVVLGCTVSLA